MNLLDSDSVWVFLSGSDEDRFLSDISFGIECIKHRQIPAERILVFIDQPSGSNFLAAYNFPFNITPQPVGDLRERLEHIEAKKLVFIVTGHGGQDGIAAEESIRPYDLLGIIRAVPNLEVSLVVLGQCYAGIFNFLEARSFDPTTNKVSRPEVCLLGATGLTTSISMPLNISPLDHPFNVFECEKEWNANLFLWLFMLGVCCSIDIDGDGDIAVTDIYKFAGMNTNQKLLELKYSALQQLFANTINDALAAAQESPPSQHLAEKSRQDLAMLSSTVLISQDPWILNANLARQMNFNDV